MRVDKVYFPILVFTAVACGFLLGSIMVNANIPKRINTTDQNKIKLNKLIDFINNDYVDTVNTDSIVDQTVNNILEKLDPHSVYIDKKEAVQESESMRGDFVGIGINFFLDNDTLAVINPIKGGPSEKAGIKAGDRILLANNKKLFGKTITNEKLFAALKGKPNSIVHLTVYRKSTRKKINLKVIRKTIPIKSVDIALMLNANTGFIKINRFAETTHKEFSKGLKYLLKKGAKKLIVDLRDNSGGYMDQAIAIADEFLSDKKLIVYTKNKNKQIEKIYASNQDLFKDGEISILINENSASASEILAGAIQDNDRGVIYGRRSFGKGLVQRELEFEDGSTVRLTIARYYTPTGRSIQKSYDKGKEEYINDFLKRYESGELYAKDSIKIADTLKFKTPKGKVLYGGGGIVPDVFVGLESSKGNEIIPILMQSAIVSNFVFKELDKNRNLFKNFSASEIESAIYTNEIFYNRFKDYVQINNNKIDFDKDKNLIKRYLVGEFCRQIINEAIFYQIVLKEDPMVKAALKL